MSRMAEQQLYIDGGYVSATSGRRRWAWARQFSGRYS
ncbi:betaine aldehyde dehydrogenase [Klebsiella oxytoca]|nr:betaine aldehyde dehydrogenase [Klebsiella oxytoca]